MIDSGAVAEKNLAVRHDSAAGLYLKRSTQGLVPKANPRDTGVSRRG